MKIFNRRAPFDYHLLEKSQAGLVLTGPEVKSVRAGRIRLEESFVQIRNGEAWLFNAHISPYPCADNRDYDPRRTRKLLLRRREILKLQQQMQQKNLTVVPVLCYNLRNKIKLEIALARGKRKYEKKEALKKRDLERELQENLVSR